MRISFDLKKKLHRTRKRETPLQNAEYHWTIILVAGFLCILGASLYHVHFYNLIEKGAFYKRENREEGVNMKFDTERVQRATDHIREREKRTDVISSITPNIVDPSQ